MITYKNSSCLLDLVESIKLLSEITIEFARTYNNREIGFQVDQRLIKVYAHFFLSFSLLLK